MKKLLLLSFVLAALIGLACKGGLEAPQMVSPQAKQEMEYYGEGHSAEIEFSWKPVEGAQCYKLVIIEDTSLIVQCVEESPAVVVFTDVVPTTEGDTTTYYWRVYSGKGRMQDTQWVDTTWGKPSEIRSFYWKQVEPPE